MHAGQGRARCQLTVSDGHTLVSLFSPERDTDNFRVDLERTLQLPYNAGDHVCMRAASEAMMSTDTTHAATPAICLPCVLCAIHGGT